MVDSATFITFAVSPRADSKPLGNPEMKAALSTTFTRPHHHMAGGSG